MITVLLTGAGVALADRKRGSWGILGALAVSQLALHFFLELTAISAHGPGHAHAPAIPLSPALMTLGHVIVTVLTALAMSHAEQVLFVVTRLLQAIVPRKTVPSPVVTPPPTVCIPAPVPRTLAQLIYQRIHARRGPPKSPPESNDPVSITGRSLQFRWSALMRA
ncbi:hypothetical protein EIL87_22670 [Saccharopolyspora rhizosphaerae]|uniref:Uncharacterized protein n=1 Tax=Saccharopolyspora rhizosphaerae TaxID=2492662 RepID=A0A3R8P0A1_9PSEU|nr:hypothetical protein [Saccharopolyspora rhizosphaerae]RRO13785.1 hypothetical protein EIL87_22670 [Saccharopolyspora rhizosphaerae]